LTFFLLRSRIHTLLINITWFTDWWKNERKTLFQSHLLELQNRSMSNKEAPSTSLRGPNSTHLNEKLAGTEISEKVLNDRNFNLPRPVPQRFVNASNVKSGQVQTDLALLIAQAQNGNCDLLVTGLIDRQQVSFIYNVKQKNFIRRPAEPESRTLAQLIAGLNEPRAVLSFLALPAGSGGQRVSPDTQSTGRRSED